MIDQFKVVKQFPINCIADINPFLACKTAVLLLSIRVANFKRAFHQIPPHYLLFEVVICLYIAHLYVLFVSQSQLVRCINCGTQKRYVRCQAFVYLHLLPIDIGNSFVGNTALYSKLDVVSVTKTAQNGINQSGYQFVIYFLLSIYVYPFVAQF